MRSEVVVPELSPLGAFCVENRAEPGTPDVAYVGGWLELKEVPTPGDLHARLRVRHFRPEQRERIRWMVARGHVVHVLLKVGPREWLLFDGVKGAEVIDHTSLLHLRQLAVKRWLTRRELRNREGGLCAYVNSLRGNGSGSGGRERK